MTHHHGGYSASGGETPPQRTTDFRYAFFDVANDPACRLSADAATVRGQLAELGELMSKETGGGETGDSLVPAGFTYLGQFIDHDITASRFEAPLAGGDIFGDFEPVEPTVVEAGLRNARMPRLELDSVYGEGPGTAASGHLYEADGIRLKLGTCVHLDAAGQPIPGLDPNPDMDGDSVVGLRNDLPRVGGVAQMGDDRNDENLIIAQLHVGFLRFHNAVVDHLEATQGLSGTSLFAEAQRQVRYHYQWLVLHDYLPNVVGTGAVYRGALDATRFVTSVVGRQHALPFMPLEFSVAAFRFGHSMVRAVYDYNRNFGAPEPGFGGTPLIPSAPFGLMFSFTGANGLTPPGADPNPQLPFNWIARWPRLFFDANAAVAPDRFARRFDTHLAQPLTNLDLLLSGVPQPTPAQGLEAHLAKRNLLRGYWLSLPTGQCLARRMGVGPLTEDEVRSGNTDETNALIDAAGFAAHTPLWYYVLKEAEVQTNGQRLGELGGRIVAATLVGLLLTDGETSFMTEAWTPDEGVVKERLGRFRSMADLLEFAGVAPPAAVPVTV